MKGHIKAIKDKGFGFIVSDDSKKDIFFHISNLEKGLRWEELGCFDEVEFDVIESAKGVSATNVCLINKNNE